MSRRVIGTGASLVLVLSGLTLLGTSPASADPPSAADLATALDVGTSGITVSTGTSDPRAYAIASKPFNDLPSAGAAGSSGAGEYVVLSTGLASDLYSTSVADDQPSTDLDPASSVRDRTTLTVTVPGAAASQCLLVDFVMATEERVHTYTAATPSDTLSVKRVGDTVERAVNRGGAYINQEGVAGDDVPYEVNKVNYWHTPGTTSDPLHGTVEDPRLPVGVTPFDSFATRDTAEVPIPSTGGDVTISIADVGNDRLDSAALIDHVRLEESCSTPALDMYPDTGVATNTARIVGYRGVGNTLTLDPVASTEDVVEKYSDSSNGWFPGDVELRFRWYRNKIPGSVPSCYSSALSGWVAIPDADRQSYVPINADKNRCLMVLVTGVKDGHRWETFPNSVAPDKWHVTLPIQDGVFEAEEPTATGVFEVGGDVTVQIPRFSPTPDSHEVQWFAGGAQISGQSGPILRLTAAQAGKTIYAKVTAKRSGFASATKSTPVYGPVKLLEMESAGTPVIGGDIRVGTSLSVDPGTWSPQPEKFTYQWKIDGTPASGGTSATYTPKSSDVGREITVEVTGAKAGYAPLSATSDPVQIAEGAMAPVAPLVSGSATVGERLTSTMSGWLPTGTTFSYQWNAGGVPIAGATASSLRIPGSVAGKVITLTVVGRRSGFATAERTSGPTATVAKGTLTSATPSISGRMKVGQTVTVRTVGWGPAGIRKTYRWTLNGKFYGGSTTRSTLKLSKSARGKKLGVRVTGTMTGYTTVVRTRTLTTKIAR